MLRIVMLCCLAALLLPPASRADVINGDFEADCTAWSADVLAGWSVGCEPAGGNPDGYGRIVSPAGNSGGEACLRQTFSCGDTSSFSHCRITFDYSLRMVDANLNTGRVKVYVDGILVFTSASDGLIPWTTESLSVACGAHTIALCLEVDPGNNLWLACFDNVAAQCEPASPVAPTSWGRIKALYR